MADNELTKPDYSKLIDIESLISAPLVAASKANVVMVTGQTRFLLEHCFKKQKNDGIYKPVMINMVMSRSSVEQEDVDIDSENGITKYKKAKSYEMIFSVPLLCLVPLNSLAINKITLAFDLEVTSANSWEFTDETGEDVKKSRKIINKGAQLYGKISYDHDENVQNPQKGQYKSSMSSKLKVNIDAGPLPLPVGVLSLIELYNRGIHPTDPNKNPDQTKK